MPHVRDPVLNDPAGQLRQPRRLLPLPSGLHHQVPARRHGRGGCRGRLDGDAMPELPRQHERRSARPTASAGLWSPIARAATPAPPRSNNGQIRYTSRFETNGAVRVAGEPTFATKPNTPAAGLSLYRFSAGHGGLQCSACHGSTHAEFPEHPSATTICATLQLQGHAGVMAECTACHTGCPTPSTAARTGCTPSDRAGLTAQRESPNTPTGSTRPAGRRPARHAMALITWARCCHGPRALAP